MAYLHDSNSYSYTVLTRYRQVTVCALTQGEAPRVWYRQSHRLLQCFFLGDLLPTFRAAVRAWPVLKEPGLRRCSSGLQTCEEEVMT